MFLKEEKKINCIFCNSILTDNTGIINIIKLRAKKLNKRV